MTFEISDAIKYAGVDVPDKKKFENQYATPHGMAYNSYIIYGEKIAILDTVDVDAAGPWWEAITEGLAGRQPDYMIVHHMEPDHSFLLHEALKKFPAMQVVTSPKAAVIVTQFFEDADLKDRIITVADGDTIDLGNRQLKVLSAPFVHWPEVIVTYDTKDKVLFSADAFGKFGAVQYEDAWLPEARRYYCNIVGKYGAQVQALFKKIANLDIKAIAPLHGPVLQGDLTPYLEAYQQWSSYTPESVTGVLVAYASVYGNTKSAALRLAEMLRMRNLQVMTFDLCNDDQSEALAQAFRFGNAVFASVTYDGGLFPAMHSFLHHLQSKNWQNRRVALIENGTWAPTAARVMKDILGKMKNIEIIEPVLSLKSALHQADMPILESIVDAI